MAGRIGGVLMVVLVERRGRLWACAGRREESRARDSRRRGAASMHRDPGAACSDLLRLLFESAELVKRAPLPLRGERRSR